MARFDAKARVIECKVVYYGPGRGGKTTNLEYVFQKFRKSTTGEMVSINTKGDRTLFFDFLPMGLGKIKGCEVKVQLFTVPGQPKYSSTRKMVLKGVDGVVFVADSLEIRKKDNLWSLKDLQQNLAEQKKDLFRTPLVLQYNKRDLAKEGLPIMPVELMQKNLNGRLKAPAFAASASKGMEVGSTLKQCLVLTLRHLQRDLNWLQ
jgi:signal recognition particle receptor subunit beta